MKRIFWVISALLLAVGLAPVQTAIAANDTNNFRITNYDIQYELSRDSESRSVLKTTETITALFPMTDQNHGLERAIPTTYDGHPTDLNITSVTNDKGEDINHRTYSSNGNDVLRIGDADTYVHGSQTYHITYTQRDVTRFFEDNGRNEWYWDTNGTDWKVPINTLSVTMKIDPAIANARVGEPACYEGVEGSTEKCSITYDEVSNEYKLSARNLKAGENVTVAFGFNKDTFAAYVESPMSKYLLFVGIMQALSFPISIGIISTMAIIWTRRKYRMKEQNPIVAEYVPPKDASVIVTSQTLFTKQAVFTAQLIDLAVRHYISIVETREKSFWRSAEYDIEIVQSLESLRDEEKEIIRDMFGRDPQPGERLALSKLKNNIAYSIRTMDNDKKLKKLVDETYGVRDKLKGSSKLFFVGAAVVGLLSLATLAIPLFVTAIVLLVLGSTLKPLSDKGLELRRYALGLDKYIKASETERLAFLQGPDTAQKVGHDVDPNNPGQIVKLYERVLPYAILFGREKQWSKRLGQFYEQSSTQPDWYNGMSGFNAAAFATSMHSFSQASSYSSGSSSSSGGSSGGGSSGGGGGGGGGGGW